MEVQGLKAGGVWDPSAVPAPGSIRKKKTNPKL